MSDHPRTWTHDDNAIRKAVAGAPLLPLILGGRFVCAADNEEDRMAAILRKEGLSLSDSGQCEVVGSMQIEATEGAIRCAIVKFRQIAVRSSCRLLAVEMGDFEGGTAIVLASEADYIPWWQVEGNDC